MVLGQITKEADVIEISFTVPLPETCVCSLIHESAEMSNQTGISITLHWHSRLGRCGTTGFDGESGQQVLPRLDASYTLSGKSVALAGTVMISFCP